MIAPAPDRLAAEIRNGCAAMRFLSLFSGIEAASVAWGPLGWQCVGIAEIEPFPCAVLKHHYPDVPNLGSVLDITDDQIAALGPIDVVVGGSPCQDLSVAGKRAGLAGARSGLFHHQLRIFHAARAHCGARYLLWENVPGAFSSNRGRDFAVVVGEMAGCELHVPDDGWGTEGVALGEHGLVEWAVLDAQWFGVAQRRRRVFAVLDVGDWASRPPILLEPDSLRRDSSPSREAGEVAPTIPSRRASGGGLGTDFDCDGGLIARPHADLSPALKARDSKGPSSDGDGDGDGAILVPMVAHSLRGEGFDASEDGAGRGTPLVPVAVDVWNQTIDGNVAATLNAESGAPNHSGPKVMVPVAFDTTQITSAANYSRPKAGDPCHPLAAGAHPPAVAFTCKDYGADASDIAPILRSMGHDGSHANGGGQVAVAFMADDYKDGGYEQCDTARPLTTSADRTRAAPIATTAMRVRRLTPTECSRLQGFPDDYLSQVPWRGKALPPDGPMYKALGNSMAVPVMRWIGERIQRVGDVATLQ